MTATEAALLRAIVAWAREKAGLPPLKSHEAKLSRIVSLPVPSLGS